MKEESRDSEKTEVTTQKTKTMKVESKQSYNTDH